MTGTDPKSGEDAEKERNQGLARSLFRVSLPRWRGGRYSLSKLFFNFYLLAMGSFVAIAFTADFVISTAQRGITDDYARRMSFSGTRVVPGRKRSGKSMKNFPIAWVLLSASRSTGR